MRNLTLAVAVLLVAITTACGGGGNPCDELKSKLCDGLDATKCNAWFDRQMKDMKSDGGDTKNGCKSLLADKDLLSGWKDLAKSGVTGEDPAKEPPAEKTETEQKSEAPSE